ncbi:MAG: AbrB/MazE/SpoVT family DNA-binding domain-containing protein [Proteobacteria bacterium]|nr:AbrB/MazE/SpoVT family DNA-binding domain-containing protein [Pseudomonadota bacterium]MBU1738133.1 AbrB/MazE/SpoVT family DNA-binding domain-containing protein [Pseudomonadota bacterium]
MRTVITSKFQTTIPKGVREKLKLSVHDALDWKVEKGKVVLEPLHKNFILRRNFIKTGLGNIEDDIGR